MNARLTPQNRLQAEDLLNEFIQQFPNAFVNPATAPVRPLKLNIHEDVREVFQDQYSRKAIARACLLYVNTPEYRDSLIPGAGRVDLAGQPCGEVTAQQVELAQQPNNRYQRFIKRIQRFERRQQLAEPKIEQCPVETLVTCRLDIVVKLTSLPQQSRSVTNGWQEFYVESEGNLIRITIRPKIWKKLQQIATTCPYWIATIRGKKGKNIEPQGFELSEPLVQIFERQASGHEMLRPLPLPATAFQKATMQVSKPYLTDFNRDNSNNPENCQPNATTLRLRNGK
jgi:ProQ/FINO family